MLQTIREWHISGLQFCADIDEAILDSKLRGRQDVVNLGLCRAMHIGETIRDNRNRKICEALTALPSGRSGNTCVAGKVLVPTLDPKVKPFHIVLLGPILPAAELRK